MGLRTRRLGTRGNSKYHYYGLRIKANSPLLRLIEDQQHLAMRQQPFSQKQRLKPVQKVEGMANGMSLGGQQQQGSGLSDISAQVQQYQQFLDASRALPEFAEIDLQGKALPDGIAMEQIKAFHLLYREHCEVGRLHDESEKRLPKGCLVVLCKYEPVLRWTKECDNMLYQGLVEILIPDVLRPIPSALTQAIRNFAKSLESWLTNAMMNIPEEMVRVKVTAASAFAQTLRRYTSLNHLAQAARAVLQNTAQINQMLSDLNRVDFANVQSHSYSISLSNPYWIEVNAPVPYRPGASNCTCTVLRAPYQGYRTRPGASHCTCTVPRAPYRGHRTKGTVPDPVQVTARVPYQGHRTDPVQVTARVPYKRALYQGYRTDPVQVTARVPYQGYRTDPV
ncbi:UNVERIFIED_CONTAM: hypothetical protein FKN15_063731 [Acipenser sinensis]